MRLDKVTRDALSIGFATGVYAVSFGVLSVAAGLSVAQTCVLSLACFTGASQFSYVSVLGAGGSVAAALGPALLLGARNGVYALSLRKVLRRRFLEAHLVIDESTAMAHAHGGSRRAFFATGFSVFAFWNAGTLTGALVGGGVDPKALGLDALFPAVFLALLAPQLRTGPGHPAPAAAIGGAVVAVVLLPLTPAGVPVMASALVGALVLARRS